MQALDRAKRVQAALTKLVERRERVVQKANAEFRLDLIAVVDDVDDDTLALVQRGLAMDRAEQGLQYALQIAVDDRNEARRRALGSGLGERQVDTRRSRDEDPHEAITEAPPPLPTDLDLGDEDVVLLDDPGSAEPFGEAFERLAQPGRIGAPMADAPAVVDVELPEGYRYPEPGEPAVELADGTVVAAGQP